MGKLKNFKRGRYHTKNASLYSSLLVISTGEAGGNKYKSYSRKPEKERGANKQKRMSTNNLSNKAHKSN